MTHLIKLTRLGGTPVWVNPAHIVTVGIDWLAEPGDGTRLVVSGAGFLSVKETPAQVLELLGLPGANAAGAPTTHNLDIAASNPCPVCGNWYDHGCIRTNCPLTFDAPGRRAP